MESHAEFLRRVSLDEKLTNALRADYRQAELSPADRAMLEYVEKITCAASGITPDDHANLKAHGFDETAILQITLLASWFNYINRVADALGVGKG